MDKDVKENIQSIILNPMFLSASAGALSGLQEGKELAQSEYERTLTEGQSMNRRFIDLKKYVAGEVSNVEEAMRYTQQRNPKLFDSLISYLNKGYRINYHPQDKILELIPSKELIKAIDNIPDVSNKEIWQASKYPIARNALVLGLSSGVLTYGPRVYNAIKQRIADNKSTKKVAFFIKEELEKRAEEQSLKQIIDSIDINEVVRRARK